MGGLVVLVGEMLGVSLVCSSVWWLVLTTVRTLVCHDKDGRPQFVTTVTYLGGSSGVSVGLKRQPSSHFVSELSWMVCA